MADDKHDLEPSDREIVVPVSEGQGVMKQEYYQEWHKQVSTSQEVYQRLNDTCPGIVYPRQICDARIVYPYNPAQRTLVNDYNGAAVSNTTSPNITADALIQMMQFALYNVAPCIAEQGLVMYDITPQHMLLRDGDAREPFQIYDVDVWGRREWYNSSVQTATEQNQFLFKLAFATAAKLYGHDTHAGIMQLQSSVKDMK